MFTLDQIAAAHATVKNGADFPRYMSDLAALGVSWYDTYVSDGHTEYFDAEGMSLESAAAHEPLEISENGDVEAFKSALGAHQRGETDYVRFKRDCAAAGVYKWVADMDARTCTYYDEAGNVMLHEEIPAA